MLVIRVMNEKVDADCKFNCEKALGKHDHVVMNDSDEGCVDFYSNNKCIIFQYKNIILQNCFQEDYLMAKHVIKMTRSY